MVGVIAVLAEVEMGKGVESVTKIQIFFLFLFQVHYQRSRVYILCTQTRLQSRILYYDIFSCELMSVERLD